jgi:mono/diheme cytochrome c family protein
LKKNILAAASLAVLMAVAAPALAQHAGGEAAPPDLGDLPEVEAGEQVSSEDIDTSERTIWDGVFTAEQTAAGEPLYTQYCQGCHGKTGRGTPGGPGVTGANLNKKWEETTLLDFYTFAHTNMPPGNAGKIGSEQDYVNIVAYIMQLHGAEPGDQELVWNEEQLGNIYIVRKPKD